jgi:hypothetical protein
MQHTEPQMDAINFAFRDIINKILTCGGKAAEVEAVPPSSEFATDTFELTFTKGGIAYTVVVEDCEDLADILPSALVMWFEGAPFGVKPEYTGRPFITTTA